MAEQKSTLNQKQKLKINSDSNIQNVCSQLEYQDQIDKFKIAIKGQSSLKDIFSVINQSLSKQSLLKDLILSFDSIKSFSFEDTLYQLSQLKNITTLSLLSFCNTTFDLNQNKLLSDCLPQFSNLISLSMDFNCELFQNQEDVFRMYPYFREAFELQDLDIKVFCVPEKSALIHSLIEGIRFLKNLKSLTIFVLNSKISSFEIIDLLEEELKDNRLLKELSLGFGEDSVITSYDFHKLGKLLKSLSQLENLTISAEYALEIYKNQNIELMSYLVYTQTLKSLNLILSRIDMKCLDLIETISKMKTLENVTLDIRFKDFSSINNDILMLGKTLSQIGCLTELKVYFDYSFPIDLFRVFQLVGELSPLRSLKVLSLYLWSMTEQQYYTNKLDCYDIQSIIDVTSRLQKFTLEKNIEWDFNEGKSLDILYKSISETAELEDLTIEITNYYDKQYIHDTFLQYIDILEKFTKLKTLHLNFGSHLILPQRQILSLFQRLKQNLQLSKIVLSFQSDVIITESDLKELSNSLILLSQLKELNITFDPNVVLNDAGMVYFAHHFNQLICLKKFALNFTKDSLSLQTLNLVVKSIAKIENLKYLDLRIEGKPFSKDEEEEEEEEKAQSFGDSFQFQPDLKYLDIYLTIPDLTFLNLKNIFKSISTLKNLSELSLIVEFETAILEDCILIRQYLANLKLLRVLALKTFSFSILHLVSLFKQLPILNYIQFIDSYKTEINCIVKAEKVITQQQTRLENREQKEMKDDIKLKIQKNSFLINKQYEKDNAQQIIPFIIQSLVDLTQLKILFYQNDDIGPQFSSLLFQELRALFNLSSLNIIIQENTKIGTESVNTLGETLLELPQLRKLYITINDDQNNIEPNRIIHFYNNLGKLESLELLEISLLFSEGFDNQLDKGSEETGVSLFRNISNLNKLNTLQVNLNQFCSKSVFLAFSCACTALKKNLKSLGVNFNTAISMDFQYMQKSIREINDLTKLKLQFPLSSYLKKTKRLVDFSQLQEYEYEYDDY